MAVVELNQKDKEILKALVESSTDGMSISDVRNAIKIIDILEETGTDVDLKEGHMKFILNRFETVKFTRADRDIVALHDKIINANS